VTREGSLKRRKRKKLQPATSRQSLIGEELGKAKNKRPRKTINVIITITAPTATAPTQHTANTTHRITTRKPAGTPTARAAITRATDAPTNFK
jgi:hypothetical protein